MICKDIIDHIIAFGDSVASLSFHLTCKHYYDMYKSFVQKKDIYKTDFGQRIFKTNIRDFIMYCPYQITNFSYFRNYTDLFLEYRPLKDKRLW